MADDEIIPISSGKGSKAPVSTKTNSTTRKGFITDSVGMEERRDNLQKTKKPRTEKKQKKSE